QEDLSEQGIYVDFRRVGHRNPPPKTTTESCCLVLSIHAHRVEQERQGGVEQVIGDGGRIDEAIDAEAVEERHTDLGEIRGGVFRGHTSGFVFVFDQRLHLDACALGTGGQFLLCVRIASGVQDELEPERDEAVIPGEGVASQELQ